MNPDGIGCDVVECFEYRFNAQGIFFDYFDQKIVMTSLGEFLQHTNKNKQQHAATAEQQRKLSRQSKPLDIYIYIFIYKQPYCNMFRSLASQALRRSQYNYRG